MIKNSVKNLLLLGILFSPLLVNASQNSLVTAMYTGEMPLKLARAVIEYDKKGDNASSTDEFNNLLFTQYVGAIVDDDAIRYSFEGEAKTYCPPTTSVGNLSVIGAQYIIDKPKERSIPLPLLLRKAWRVAYPCDSK